MNQGDYETASCADYLCDKADAIQFECKQRKAYECIKVFDAAGGFSRRERGRKRFSNKFATSL